jgi:hypothetical protein
MARPIRHRILSMKARWLALRQLFTGFCTSFTAPGPAAPARREALDRAGRASGYQWMRCVD